MTVDVTKYSYDGDGRLARTTLPDNTYTTSTYDLAGRQLTSSSHSATGTSLAVQSYRYDRAGNVIASTDANNTVTRFEYDATGVLTKEIQPISGSDSIETTFGYDLMGNNTRFTDGRGNAFLTTYNSWNLPESQIEPSTTAHSAMGDRTFTTAYDVAGRPIRQTLPGGVSITNVYDVMGQLVRQEGAGAEAATDERVFGYDPAGRIKEFSSPGGTNTISYDDRGLPLTVTGPSGNSSFTYTPDGMLASRADAAGTTSYGYDQAGRLSTVVNPTSGIQLAHTYNSLSQVTKTTYGAAGNTRNFRFDDLHRPDVDELKTASGTSIAKITYGWDPNGNLKSKATTGFAGSAVNTYTYDQADRLTSWNNGTSTVVYAYDKSGNRLQNGSKRFSYDQRNRLLTADGATYSYTARGTLAAAGGVATSTDAFGQVRSQAFTGGGSASYGYDALGRAVRSGFAYTGLGNSLAADGGASYVRGPGGGLLGVAAGGSQRYAWTDLHTDVVGQFVADGGVLAGSTTYDPLGVVLTSASLLGSLGYQSEWTDTSTGRVNMHARWYNAETGQFDTRDTASNSPIPGGLPKSIPGIYHRNPYTRNTSSFVTVRNAAGKCSSDRRKPVLRIFQHFRWAMARSTAARIRFSSVLHARRASVRSRPGGFLYGVRMPAPW